MTRHPKPDVAQVITDLILEKIAAGTAPWLGRVPRGGVGRFP